MPTVERFHDPRFTVGQNAFVSYLGSFLETRREVNRYVLEQRMKAMDPAARLKEMGQLRRHIADLEKLKANVLRDGARGHAQSLDTEMEGRWRERAAVASSQAAVYSASASVAVAKIRGRTDLEVERMKGEAEARADMPGSEAQRLALAGADRVAGSRGGAVPLDPLAVADDALKEALAAEKAGQTGRKADNIRYEFYLSLASRAEAEADPNAKTALLAARDGFGREHFGAEDAAGVAGEMERRHGLLSPAESAAHFERIVGGGVAGGPPPPPAMRQSFSVSGPAGGTTGVPAPGAGEPGAVPGGTSGEAGTLPASDPLSVALGIVPSIEAQIGKAEAELAELSAERKAGLAARARGGFPGFTRNVFLEPLFAAPGTAPEERQSLIRLAAENDPRRLATIHEYIAQAGGDPVKALETARAEGGLPAFAPRFAAVADPGTTLFSWMDAGLGEALEGLASADPARKREGARRLAEVVRVADNNSDVLRLRAPDLYQRTAAAWEDALASEGAGPAEAPDDPSGGSRRVFRRDADGRLFIVADKTGNPYKEPKEVLPTDAEAFAAIGARIDSMSRAKMLATLTAARQAAQASAPEDVHFAEVLADRAKAARSAQTPEEKVGAARELSQWAAAMPSTLSGQWGEATSRILNDDIAAGRGHDLLRDLANIEGHGYRTADEERERTAREAAILSREGGPPETTVAVRPVAPAPREEQLARRATEEAAVARALQLRAEEAEAATLAGAVAPVATGSGGADIAAILGPEAEAERYFRAKRARERARSEAVAALQGVAAAE